ncbi:MAG: DUF2914 domain-containing protein, partial [Myxococcota bacterium]|nr:DUF2914 domain-containing protein [Myxococcota bacterium]
LAVEDTPPAIDDWQEGDCDEDDGEPVEPTQLHVVDAAVAHGVSRRQPVRPSERFHVGQVVWAWTAVANRGETAPVTMLWRRDGVVRSRMTLEVGKSPRWRTWSRRTLRGHDVGAWQVEVLDAQGAILRTLSFEVAPRPVDLSLWDDEVPGC